MNVQGKSKVDAPTSVLKTAYLLPAIVGQLVVSPLLKLMRMKRRCSAKVSGQFSPA